MRQSYSQLTEAEKEIICNGCGFCVGKKNHCLLERLIPDFNWTDVCNEHDYYTEAGGYLTEYLGTQLVFFGKIVMKISDYSSMPLVRLWILTVALVYFLFVFIFGIFAFNWGKPMSIAQVIEDLQK